MTDLEGFRKVLSALSKEDLVNISDNFGLPTSGKKEKLVEIILKNPTFLEDTIEVIVKSYKHILIEVCEILGIESDASASELRQQILQKLDEVIDNKDLQKQIKFLNICFDKDDLADQLDEFGLSTSGKKSDLIELIAKNDSIMLFSFKEWKSFSDKGDIEYCCEELGIKSDGVRKDLEFEIEDYLFKKEKNVSNNIESEINDRKKRNVLKNKKVNYDYDHVFLDIIETLKNELKPEPCRDERELQGHLKTFLTTKYPEKSVEREVPTKIAEGVVSKIDFLIDGKYVIELKLARNKDILRDFIGQLQEYQKVYPQIAALLLFDDTKMNETQINHYVGEYGNYNIPSIVVNGRITKKIKKKFAGAMDTD